MNDALHGVFETWQFVIRSLPRSACTIHEASLLRCRCLGVILRQGHPSQLVRCDMARPSLTPTDMRHVWYGWFWPSYRSETSPCCSLGVVLFTLIGTAEVIYITCVADYHSNGRASVLILS